MSIDLAVVDMSKIILSGLAASCLYSFGKQSTLSNKMQEVRNGDLQVTSVWTQMY